MSQKTFSIYEAAAHLQISPMVLSNFTRYCPKYKEDKRLPVFKKENDIEYFLEKELTAYNKYLSEPWPIPAGKKRADIPEYMVLAIKQESKMTCAFCNWAQNLEIAHIIPWSKSQNNHPHNLIASCPNHHSQYDFGFFVRLAPSITESDVKRIKKENLKQLRAELSVLFLNESKITERLNEIEIRVDAKFDEFKKQFLQEIEVQKQQGFKPEQAEIITNEQTDDFNIEINVKENGDKIPQESDAGPEIEFEPAFWRQDSLTNFMHHANSNIKKTFGNLPDFGKRIIEISELTFSLVQTLKLNDSVEKTFASMFFSRAHSSLLAAIRLGMSGQFPEAQLLLKSSLLHALFSVHVSESSENIMIFLKQNTSDQNAARFRKAFRESELLVSLRKKSVKVEKITSALLALCDEWGSPGKSFELFGNVNFDTKESWSVFTMGNSPKHFLFCLKQIARTQICCLMILQTIYPDRFRILCADEKLLELMEGL